MFMPRAACHVQAAYQSPRWMFIYPCCMNMLRGQGHMNKDADTGMDSDMERGTDIDTDMDLDTHMDIKMDMDTDMDVTLPRTWIWTPVVFKSIFNNLIKLIKLNEIIT
jgi:hypothetical protein